MGLRGTGLIAPLEARKDAVLLLQRPRSGTLHLEHLVLANLHLGRDHVEVQVLSQDDNTGPLGRLVPRPHRLDRHDIAVL